MIKLDIEMDLDMRNPVYGGLQTTEAQTSLRIGAVWSAPLLFTYCKSLYLDLLRVKLKFLASLCSRGHQFEYRFVGNPEDSFSRDEAQIRQLMRFLYISH